MDKEKVKEVIMFAENDYKSYEALHSTYLDNLRIKKLKGVYDKTKAAKLLEYWYSNFVRPSMKNPRNYGFDPRLNPAERKAFASYFERQLWDEHLKNVRPKKGVSKTRRKLKKK